MQCSANYGYWRFLPSGCFHPQEYFKDIVGVTRNIGDSPTEILFLANHVQAPYVRTKPIHHSQKTIEQRKEGTVFSITVIPNFELERELIGFGEGLTVLSPASFVRSIKRKVCLLYANYFPKGGWL
ncbi:MAG TPA: WYL domain-containing protein [Niabella sp.]|nr:WYL domain-containing protein [Niabella sp.]